MLYVFILASGRDMRTEVSDSGALREMPVVPVLKQPAQNVLPEEKPTNAKRLAEQREAVVKLLDDEQDEGKKLVLQSLMPMVASLRSGRPADPSSFVQVEMMGAGHAMQLSQLIDTWDQSQRDGATQTNANNAEENKEKAATDAFGRKYDAEEAKTTNTAQTNVNGINSANSNFQAKMARDTAEIAHASTTTSNHQTTIGNLVETVMDDEVAMDDTIKEDAEIKVDASAELAADEEKTVLDLAKESGDAIDLKLSSTKSALVSAIVDSMVKPAELDEESKENKDDFDDAAKETNSANKAGRKEVQAAGKADRKEIMSVLKDTKNEPASIYKELASINKDTAKELKGEAKESARDIRDIFKDAQGDQKKAKSAQKKEFKSAMAEEKAINKETLAAGKAITNEEKGNFAEALAKQVEIDSTLAEANEDAEEARENADLVFTQANSQRERAKRAIASAANEGTNEAKDFYSQTVTKLEAQLRDDKSTTFAERNAEVSQAKGEVQKKLDDAEATMAAAIANTQQAIANTDGSATSLASDIDGQKTDMKTAVEDSTAIDLKTVANEDAVLAAIDTASTTVGSNINSTKADLMEEMAQAETKTTEDIAKADEWSEDAVNTTEANLEDAVNNAVAEQADRLTQVNRSQFSASQRINDTFNNMDNLITNINTMRDDTFSSLPEVTTQVDNAVEKIQSEVGQAEASVQTTQEHLKRVTEEQQTLSQRELSLQSGKISQSLQDTLGATQANTQKMIDESSGLYNTLAHNVQQDYVEIEGFQRQWGNRIADIYANASHTSEKVKSEVTKLQSLISATETSMGDTKSYLQKLGFDEGQQVQATAASMQADAEARVAAVGTAAGESANNAMDGAYAKGAASQDAEAAKIAQYLNMTLSEVQALLMDEKGLAQLASKAKAKAAASDEQRSAYVNSLNTQMRTAESETDAKMKAARADIAQYGSEFNQQIGQGTSDLHNHFGQQLNGAAATQAGAEAQMQGSMSMHQSDLKNRVGVWSSNVNNEVGGIQGKLNTLSHSVLGVEARAGSLAGNLDHDADVLARLGSAGQHQLLLALQKAQASGNKLSKEELAEMDALAEDLLKDRNKAGMELNVLTDEFDQVMNAFHDTARQQVGTAANQLQRLMDSSPDLAAAFDNSLRETRQSVAETSQKIDQAVTSTLADEDMLTERLDAAKTNRAKQSDHFKQHVDNSEKTLNAKVADVKGVMDGLLNKVEETKIFTDQGIKKFTESVSELSGVTTDHNEEVLDTIDSELSEYKLAHTTLQNWGIQNKHQSNAWRGEVERQLKLLLYSLDENAAAEAGSQLSEELDMNSAMRDLQKHIEGDSAKSQVSNSAYLTKVLGRTENLVKTAMGDEEGMEGKVTAEEEGAASKMSAEEKRNSNQVNQLADNENQLKSKAEDLDTELQVVSGSMKSQLVLPMQTASKENVAIDNKMRLQNSILKSMQGRYPEPESFAEVAEGKGSASAEDEKAALHKLNSELYRELVEDVRDNSQMEDGLKKMKHMP